MARGVAEVEQAALRQQQDAVTVGEGVHVHLRLHLDMLQVAKAVHLSISLSKWPMLPTIAMSFISRM